jgi:hypothetical protein
MYTRVGIVALLASTSIAAPGWVAEVVLTAPGKLGACAVADIDAHLRGNEIVAVCGSGEVFVVGRAGRKWKHEVMFKAPGEMIQCAAGELDPATGDEVVVVGMLEGAESGGGPGAAYLLRAGKKGWMSDLIFRDTALLHAVCVGEIDPGRPGSEVLVAGFSGKATLLFRDGDRWGSETVADLGSAGKNAVAFDGGAVVACTSGRLVHLKRAEGGWTSSVLDEVPAGQSRVGTDGVRLLSSRDDGTLGLVTKDARADIHREEGKLRGAVLADVDPRTPGVEAVTAGYSHRLTVLREENSGWLAETVFEDTDALHHVAAGELLSEGTGTEIVTCGYSRRLVVVHRAR